MKDEIKNKAKMKTQTDGSNAVTIILIIAIIILSCMCIAVGFKYWVDTERLKISLTSHQKTIMNYEKTFVVAKAELVSCHDELDKLRARISGIKNADDLMKRDIFLYIDKTFQFVPKTVAADIALQIVGQCKIFNMSPELIMAIIQVESSFNPMAISKKDARGLMQVMPEWVPKLNLEKVSDLHDINTNIIAGIKVLQIHIKEAKGNIGGGLYRYVGKSDSYAGKVYEAVGTFVTFRSTIDDEKINAEMNGKEDKEGSLDSGTVKGTKENN